VSGGGSPPPENTAPCISDSAPDTAVRPTGRRRPTGPTGRCQPAGASDLMETDRDPMTGAGMPMAGASDLMETRYRDELGPASRGAEESMTAREQVPTDVYNRRSTRCLGRLEHASNRSHWPRPREVTHRLENEPELRCLAKVMLHGPVMSPDGQEDPTQRRLRWWSGPGSPRHLGADQLCQSARERR
jgi:hypothetical protein